MLMFYKRNGCHSTQQGRLTVGKTKGQKDERRVYPTHEPGGEISVRKILRLRSGWGDLSEFGKNGPYC